jgi:NTP pyrophosphatase (non-canonical NTP hydrolase)
MNFKQAMDETKQVASLFEQTGSRPWSIEVKTVELASEVGTLADTIMIKERFRFPRENQTIDLEDDVVDVLFVLFLIAEHYGIDLDTAYQRLLNETREKLSNAQRKK